MLDEGNGSMGMLLLLFSLGRGGRGRGGRRLLRSDVAGVGVVAVLVEIPRAEMVGEPWREVLLL